MEAGEADLDLAAEATREDFLISEGKTRGGGREGRGVTDVAMKPFWEDFLCDG